jgi:hypothetical protein
MTSPQAGPARVVPRQAGHSRTRRSPNRPPESLARRRDHPGRRKAGHLPAKGRDSSSQLWLGVARGLAYRAGTVDSAGAASTRSRRVQNRRSTRPPPVPLDECHDAHPQ